jgi:hypothetical protein
MADIPSKATGILGLRPAAEALKTAIETARDFLTRICGPAADEVGQLLRDRVSYWRMTNAIRLLEKARLKMDSEGPDVSAGSAHPRLVMRVVDQGSWTSDDQVLEMWAGLLASSRSTDGQDDGNLIFITLLEQLTTAEAHVLQWVCERAEKKKGDSGLIDGDWVHPTISELTVISKVVDIHRLDRELDHLRALQLTEGGIPINDPSPGQDLVVHLRPTGLGLNLYVRCQGTAVSPIEYFSLQ